MEFRRKAAEQRYDRAQYSLGCMYSLGHGVPQDYKEAARWDRKAAEQRYDRAQYSLGLEYSLGRGVPQDYKEAVRWYRKAAEQGNAGAQHSLGTMYYFGDGVPQDYKEAVRWYRKAAELGNVFAQCKLGPMYYKGQGVSQDYKEAVRWYRKAAELGISDAQCNLGYMYSLGQGVTQDYKEAVRWYREAAEQGYADAQYNLGIMYRKGYGVPQDYIRTYAWWNLAASQGDTDAAKFRNDLANTVMTPQQIAVAQEFTVELQDKIENRSSAATSETEKSQSKGVGTGFFITRDGYILTCYHVVEKANSVQVFVGDKMYEADIKQIDIHNDLSLLKIRGVFPAIAFSPARSVKLGESIFTIGYPNQVLQGYAAKLTRGEINSLSGYRDDPRLYQISAPVQPGNSGGALVDGKGYVVGIVVAILDARAALKITGALPQNVNYAIKGTYALAFLDALPEVSRKLILPEKNPKKSFEKIVDHVKKCTVMIVPY
jgi:TPR repeat protein